jgi:hypothetical protein
MLGAFHAAGSSRRCCALHLLWVHGERLQGGSASDVDSWNFQVSTVDRLSFRESGLGFQGQGDLFLPVLPSGK